MGMNLRYSPLEWSGKDQMFDFGGYGVSGLMLQALTTTGNVFYASSVATDSGFDSANREGTSYAKPFKSLDYTIGRCTANNGDVILLLPGHAETLAVDSAVDLDVAGVTVIGLGNGEDRPTFTFTATAADFKMAAASTRVARLIFKNNSDGHDMDIEVSGTDAEIAFCSFREGTHQTELNVQIGVDTDNEADRCWIHHCDFYTPTAGDGDAAVSFIKDMINVVVEDCFIYGDYDLAGISIPSTGDAQVNCTIRRCEIYSIQANAHAIEISGTTCTGRIVDCNVYTDAIATAIDAGGLEVFNTWYHDGTDQTSATRFPAVGDSATNFIGVDDNSNLGTTSSVTADEDGSILERLEQIQEAVNVGTGTSMPSNKSVGDLLGLDPAYCGPRLGFVVTKACDLSGANDDLFTVTGKVLITLITGEVTGAALTGAESFQLRIKTDNIALCAATTIDTDAEGTQYIVTGDFGDAFNGGGAMGLRAADCNTLGGRGEFVVGDAGGTATIESNTTGNNGTITFTLCYIPLEASAAVAAAA